MKRHCSIVLLGSALAACSGTGLAPSSGTGSSSGANFGGSSGGSGSPSSCGCSAACCSAQASASSTSKSGGLVCPDGADCYGSWYCSLAPAGGCSESDPCNGHSGSYSACGSSTGGDLGSSGGSSGGVPPPTPTGTVGPAGGSVSSLVFAVVGDTRPQKEGDTADYPTQDIGWIYQNILASSPRPQFVIATGDYAYCSGSDCAAQTANYISAAQQYYPSGGQLFLAMGNHECNGETASNCAADNYLDGVTGPTPNFTNFWSMLGTFGLTSNVLPTLATGNPYYSFQVTSSDSTNPWTAKFVVIAANAWDSAQSSWLSDVMQQTTTYTFVVRHESYEDDGAAKSDQPGDQGESDKVIDAAPYTMLLVGHTHEYAQSKSGSGQVELIVGNGGAETSGPPGYVICSQQSGGNISCQPYAAATTASTNGSAVLVNAAGATQ